MWSLHRNRFEKHVKAEMRPDPRTIEQQFQKVDSLFNHDEPSSLCLFGLVGGGGRGRYYTLPALFFISLEKVPENVEHRKIIGILNARTSCGWCNDVVGFVADELKVRLRCTPISKRKGVLGLFSQSHDSTGVWKNGSHGPQRWFLE